ncbi:MAG TPA: hypothetical protein VFF73_09920, partial [Planctomycetota bacterium]|nr:hypothetical protein [Planctomycetota bacterium]
ACALCALFAVAYPSTAREDMVIIQKSNGFPGATGGEEARQKVLISEDKLKVLDQDHDWGLLVRLDTKTVQELDATNKTYVERPFSFFQDMRDKREKTRKEIADEFNKQMAKEKDASEQARLRRSLDDQGIAPNGQTFAFFQTAVGDIKTATVIVNGKKEQLQLQRYTVRENSGPPVFEIWATSKIAKPPAILKFYREIGTFSSPVINELEKKLEGFPIEITAVLDDGVNKKTLRSQILEVRDEAVPANDYTIPAGFKPAPAKAAAPAQAAVKCVICGKDCVPGVNGASYFTKPFTNERYPVCSDEHRAELMKKLSEQKPPK